MSQAKQGSSAHLLSKLRILIVDDNQDAAQGLSLLLEMKGCKVHLCYNGNSALQEYKKFNPNVFILDIGLPDITGNVLLQTIRSDLKTDFKSIALTGFGHKQARQETTQAGFDYHLNKPVALATLIRVLRECAE